MYGIFFTLVVRVLIWYDLIMSVIQLLAVQRFLTDKDNIVGRGKHRQLNIYIYGFDQRAEIIKCGEERAKKTWCWFSRNV